MELCEAEISGGSPYKQLAVLVVLSEEVIDFLDLDDRYRWTRPVRHTTQWPVRAKRTSASATRVVATRIRPRFARARVESAQAAELCAPENCWHVASDPVLSIN